METTHEGKNGQLGGTRRLQRGEGDEVMGTAHRNSLPPELYKLNNYSMPDRPQPDYTTV